MRTMIILLLLSALLSCNAQSPAQKSSLSLTDLPSTLDTSIHFPFVSTSNPRVAEKINTFLQFERLEHLPGEFKNDPFEKVVYDSNNCCSSLYFESWSQNKSPKNILSLSMSGIASGAYPEEFTEYPSYDLRTGDKIMTGNLMTPDGMKALTLLLNTKSKKIIDDFVTEISDTATSGKADEEEMLMVREQIRMYTYCVDDILNNGIGYYEYYFDKDSMVFVRGRCSAHVNRALDDLYNLILPISYSDLSKYLSAYGKSLIFGKTDNINSATPEGKIFKGTIDGKYAVTCMVSHMNDDGSLSMSYWYDKHKKAIEWSGMYSNGKFSLKELKAPSGENENWETTALIEAAYEGENILGSWQDVKSGKVMSLKLKAY